MQLMQTGDTMAFAQGRRDRTAAQFNAAGPGRVGGFAGTAGRTVQECPAPLAVCHKCGGTEHEWGRGSMGGRGIVRLPYMFRIGRMHGRRLAALESRK